MSEIRCFVTGTAIMTMAIAGMVVVAIVGGLIVLLMLLIDLPYLLRVKRRECLNIL